jgi:tetratricopeptide (TPR) repeat protein
VAGFSSYTYHWTFRIVCFLFLLGLAALQLFISRQEQTAYSGTSGSAAMLGSLYSSSLLTWHAKRLHLLEGEMAQGEDLFKRALVQNPLFIPAWLGLAELRNDQGRKPESQAILEYVDQLSADISRWRWDKALLAYQLGRLDILSRDLSYIIEKIPGKSRQSALKMAFSIWNDPQELLSRMGTQNVLYLFNYAAQTTQIDTALAFWPYIEKMGVEANKKDVLTFLNALILNKKIAIATPIWKKYFNSQSLLYDGSFLEEPMNTAFGWRVEKPKGSTWRIESGKGKEKSQAMRLHFSGTENIAFTHLSQIVPLASARKYSLTGWLKTEKLTTDQRPYLEVVGYKCNIPPAKTEIMAKSQPWTPFTLSFNVSEECEAVQVRVRRDPSKHLDNLLAGDLWLRDLEIHNTGEIESSSDTKLLLHDLQIHDSGAIYSFLGTNP